MRRQLGRGTALPLFPVWRHHDFMTTRGWRRLGWGIFAAALIGLAVYMVAVGWNRASLIAGVASFFLAATGLAVTLAARPPAASDERVRIATVMRDVTAGGVIQDVVAPSAGQVVEEMTCVTSRDKPAEQRVRVAGQQHADEDRTSGAGDD